MSTSIKTMDQLRAEVAQQSGIPSETAPTVATPQAQTAAVKTTAMLRSETAAQTAVGMEKELEYADFKKGYLDHLGLKPGAWRGVAEMVLDAGHDTERILTGDPEALAAVRSGISGAGGGLVDFGKSALTTNPLTTGANLAKGIFEQVIQHPWELATNEHMGSGGLELDPLERAYRGRELASNLIGAVVGVGVSKHVAARMIGQEAIAGSKFVQEASKSATTVAAIIKGPIDTRDLLRLANTAARADQAIPIRRFADTIGGASEGFVSGYLQGTTIEERVNAGLIYAVVAAPLGTAAGMVGNVIDRVRGRPINASQIVAQKAYAAAELRQLKNYDDVPIAQVLVDLDNVATYGDFGIALAARHINYVNLGVDRKGNPIGYGRGAQVIPGQRSPDGVVTLVRERNQKPDTINMFNTVVHKNVDGMYDILLAPLDMSLESRRLFQKTGFVDGQQVSYGGSDAWFISKQQESGPGKTLLELRHRQTNELVKNVDIKDVIKPASLSFGDIFLMQPRMLTLADISDPAQGFSKGGNWIDDKSDFLYDAADFTDTAVTEVNSLLGSSFGFNARGVKSFGGQELRLGRNIVKEREGNLPSGASIIMGGETVIMDVLGPDGKIHKTPVKIGEEGDIVSILTWREEKGVRVEFVGSDTYYTRQDLSEPAKAHIRSLQQKTRVEFGLHKSASSLSPGGKKSILTYNNLFARPKDVAGELGVLSREVMEREVFQRFLDFIGLLGEDIKVAPAELITRVGWGKNITVRSESIALDNSSAIDGSVVDPRYVGQRGATRTRLLDEVTTYEGHELARTTPTEGKYFTESKRELTSEEAMASLKRQTTAGEVPTLARKEDIPFDPARMKMSFDDIFNTFVKHFGIKDELVPKLREWMEYKLGQELLGETNIRSRYPDLKEVHMWKEEIRIIDKDIKGIEHALSTPPTRSSDAQKRAAAGLDEALRTEYNTLLENKAILQNRIKQIETAEPLPFAPEEREVLVRLKTEVTEARRADAKTLNGNANTLGFVVEREPGVIRFRDIETNTLQPVSFADEATARDWINKNGSIRGIELDAGNLVPPGGVIGDIIPPPTNPLGPHAAPHGFAQNSRVSKIVAWMDATVPWFTPKRAFFVALDNLYGTRIYEEVYLPLQIAKLRSEAAKRPHMIIAKEAEQMLMKAGIPRERWTLLSDNIRTASIDEIKQSRWDRPMTPLEIKYAEHLANRKIDLQTVFEFRRAIKELQDDFNTEAAQYVEAAKGGHAGAAAKLAELEAAKIANIEATSKAFVIDDNQWEAVRIMDEIASKPLDQAKIGPVAELASALMNPNGALTKAEHALKHKLSPAELAARDKLIAGHASVAKAAAAPANLSRYIAHFKRYGELPESDFKLDANDIGGGPEEAANFIQRMVKSGEMNFDPDMMRDPVLELVQFANAAMNDRHFNRAWETAKEAGQNNLKLIPEGRAAPAKVVAEYVDGLRGIPSASQEFAQSVFEKFMDMMGIEKKVDIRKDVINTYLAGTSGAMLGFRPAQAIRDFIGFHKVYYTRFGQERFNNGMRLAYAKDGSGVSRIRRLGEEGTIPGLGVLEFMTDAEIANTMAGKGSSKIKKLIFDASKLGMELSGQPNVYSLAHATAYLDTRDVAYKALKELTTGRITKDVAYKKMGMNSYDLPVAEGFDRLVVEGKMDEAVEYLAHATGIETAFMYGIQNHPYLWGSNIGRLATQFGTWSVWSRNHLGRLAGRGTPGERAAAIARYGAAEAGTFLIGKTLGFNVNSWYMAPAMIFRGGVAVSAAGNAADLTGQRGKLRQDLAKSKITKGKIPVLSQLMPGGFAFADYYQAVELAGKRYGPIAVLGKGLGFSIDEGERSLVDELSGNYPELRRR